MNFRRGSTASPMRIVKISSVSDSILDLNLEQRAFFRIHCGFPKLLGIHFTQALITLDLQILLSSSMMWSINAWRSFNVVRSIRRL